MSTAAADSELVRRFARAGEQEAFAELVRRYVGLVYHAAWRQTGGRADVAADIAQQVFTLLARKAPALENHAALAGWLHTTTRNVTRDTLRAERRRRAREQEAFAMHELTRDETHRNWEQVRPVLDAAIGELPAGDRDAVLLRFFAALPLAEIGRRLGVSENAARMRIDRALDKLGRQLRRHGVTSSAATLEAVLVNPALAAPGVPAGLAGTVTTAALASAAPAGALAGALAFMSTAKWLGVSVAALVVLGVVGTITHQRRAGIEAALHTAQQEHARMIESLRQAEAAAAEADERLVQAQKQADETRQASAADARPAAVQPGNPPSPAAQRAALVEEGRAFLERHPAVRQALNDYVRASLKFQYGPIYRELRLTPEQIEQFENLRGMGTGMGAPTADGRSMTLMFADRPPSDFSARMEAVLGEEGARRMTEYAANVAGRRVAADVASALYFTETPLTPGQTDQLVAIVAASRLPRNGGFDWDRLMQKASGVLSAPQLEVLAARRAGDEFNRFLNRPRGETVGKAPAN